MIIFERIRWKNFLATGDKFTEIILNECGSTLIVGENGAGKSTILDALTFVLFGKSFRKINKPQIVNSINGKDCVVEIEFSIGDNEYKVIRSIKPSIFNIYVNDRLLDQDSRVKDSQKYLEDSILKLNYKSFTQTVLLGSATFIPFMQLNTSDRRDIIEDILDIKIFSYMNDIIKNNESLCKNDLMEVSSKLDILEHKVSLHKKFISDKQKNTTDIINNNKEKISQKQQLLKNNSLEIDRLDKNILDLRDSFDFKIDKFRKRLKGINKVKYKMDASRDMFTKVIEWFSDKSECPSCKQDISDEYKKVIISENINKIDNITASSIEVSDEISRVEERITNLNDIRLECSELENTSLEYRMTNNSLLSSIEDLNNDNKSILSDVVSTSDLIDELESYEYEYDDFVERKKELSNDKHHYSLVSKILNDDGVKISIIKYYLPKINHLINVYLHKMNFYVNFKLDAKFSETIESMNRNKFTYSSFSEGERMRIDLALLFTWRDIARMKNSVNTNLLILDEVFDSSLDTNGTDDFLKLISSFVDRNVFIISHKGDILYDKFAKTITFEKKRNFSFIKKDVDK